MAEKGDGVVRCFASDFEAALPARGPRYDLDMRQITEILAHRFPFLLIDRIIELHPLRSIRGYKNITHDEPVLLGHFPGNPVFPALYIIEALAQLAGCIVLEPGQFWKNPPYFTGIDKARFRRKVVPGDRLMMDVQMQGHRRNVFWMSGIAKVEDELVCTAALSFAVTLGRSHPALTCGADSNSGVASSAARGTATETSRGAAGGR
jgi:3-hydroxyacyl-[acyl-carrier-protein] dehydratase